MNRKKRSRHTSKFSRQSSSRFEQLENRNLLAADIARLPIADAEQIDIVAETSANTVNAQQLSQALESADEGFAADVGGASTSADERVRVIVRLSEQDATDSVLQSVTADATNVRPMSHIPVVIMEVPESQIERISETEGVVSVTRDYAQPHTLASAIPITRVDEVHARGITGGTSSPRPTVVVIDDGIDSSHPFFQGGPQGSRIINQACFSTPMNGDEESLCAPAPNVADVNIPVCNPFPFGNICNHGTHVAGIAAGNMNADPGNSTDQGVAPGVDIIAIQAFTRFNDAIGDCNGTIFSAPCTRSYVSDQVAALDFVVGLSNNNHIWNIAAVNMSLGGGSHATACDNDPTKPAIDALLANGVATVIAAGNDSLTNGVSAPGCVSTAFTVGSTTDSDGVSDFSNRGELLDAFAPGSNIRSSVPGGYAIFNGTSMAAPHVAGALALLRDAHPDRSITELMQDLEDTGVPISYSSGGSTVITPRIDVHAAMGTDTNDQLSEAEFLSIPFSENGTIDDNGNDVDMYQFTVSPGQIVGFDIDRTSGNLDSYLRLFDSNGNQIAAQDDGDGATPEPSNVDSYLEYYFPTGGTYYIGVSHWQNQDYDAISGHDDDTGTTGGYSLHLTDLGGDSNRTIGQAEAQAVGNSASGSVAPSVDVDMFSFTVATGQTVQFDLTVTGGAGLDSRLRLFDSGGTELRSVNDSGVATSFEHTFPVAGTYYIGVSDAGNNSYDPVTGSGPHNDNVNETGSFVLQITNAPPTILEVSSIGDASDGNHTPGNLTLREAMELANIGPDANEITFDTAGAFSTPQTILIGSPLPDINSDVAINAPGADIVTIDAGGNSGRIFHLASPFEINAEISGMTLTGADGSLNGGAILNRENLTVRDVVVTGNLSLLGGGIYNANRLAVIDTTISDNHASQYGGGIANLDGATTSIDNSTISGNTAGRGGGISNVDGDLTIRNSSVIGNSGYGGGIRSQSTAGGDATVQISNSTFSGNTTTVSGGGIRGVGYNNHVTIENSTFTGNSAVRGGGVDVVNTPLTINNTIVAGNSANTNPDITISEPAVGSYNLIGDGMGLSAIGFLGGSVGNQIDVDPLLGPLADNGGSTLTHALLPGSPAINGGDPAFSGLSTDQRGESRVSGGIVDIGAVEAHPAVVRDLGTIAEGTTNEPGQLLRVGEVFFYRFDLNENVSAVEGRSLVIDTLGTVLGDGSFGMNDTEIGLYDAHGSLVASNDDIDTVTQRLSELRFGDGGSSGDLPAGTYYLAMAAFDSSFTGNFTVTSASDFTGDVVVNFSLTTTPVIDADFNNDGSYDCADIDALTTDIATGTNSPEFDLTGDSLVNAADLTQWLSDAASENGLGSPYRRADFNLDGSVDVSDFNIWNSNKFTSGAWCSADGNADGIVDVSDFNLWNSNKFTSSDIATVQGPSYETAAEPVASVLPLPVGDRKDQPLSQPLVTFENVEYSRPQSSVGTSDRGREEQRKPNDLVDLIFAQLVEI